MGLQFDILTDTFLLNETSEFSQFFNNIEPIKTIHNELKVSHDTKLVLGTANRHDLWPILRDGKALFVVINKKSEIRKASAQLKNALKTRPSILKNIEGRGHIYYKIKHICDAWISKATTGEISSRDYRILRKKFNGYTHDEKPQDNVGLISQAVEIYHGDTTVADAMENFLIAVAPGDRILVKRQPGPKFAENQLQKPEEREFPTRDPVDKNDKKFGQVYTSWTFSPTGIIKKEHSYNAVTVFNTLFPGWGDRDFYVIENEKFLKTQKHPFANRNGYIKFEKILPINKDFIENFTMNAFKKFENILIDKMKNNTELLKQKATADIGQEDISDDELNASILEYRKALKLVEKGVAGINATKVFRDFLVKDTRINLGEYSLVTANLPHANPYKEKGQTWGKEKWIEMDQQKGLSNINDILGVGLSNYTGTDDGMLAQKARKEEGKGFSALRPRMITVRPKTDRNHIMQIDANQFLKAFSDNHLNANDYEMKTADKPTFTTYRKDKKGKILTDRKTGKPIKIVKDRWVPFDPTYIENIKTTDGVPSVAIAFRGDDYINEYNNFVRRFIVYALRTVIKTPENKVLDDMMNLF